MVDSDERLVTKGLKIAMDRPGQRHRWQDAGTDRLDGHSQG
jgi:hypothetical protein